MEAWRKVWRDGIADQISVSGLEAVKDGIEKNDQFLLQGSTTSPPPHMHLMDKPCTGACLFGYVACKAYGACTVAEVEQHFVNMCHETDRRIGEPDAVRYFLNWFDDTPREEMRRELLSEVNLELACRYAAQDEIAQSVRLHQPLQA